MKRSTPPTSPMSQYETDEDEIQDIGDFMEEIIVKLRILNDKMDEILKEK